MTGAAACTAEEMMVVAAARMLVGRTVCFVGIGLPSAAALLARRTHAPELVLVYESGTLGARPERLPLSVADEDIATTARAVVSVPEMFNYWLQPGRIQLALLGTAQVDRFGNLNSTVIGDYGAPKVRLPGAGGAPEIAAACARTIVIVKQNRRTFVDKLDFVTTVGHGRGAAERRSLGFPGGGPAALVTDVGVYEPAAGGGEFVLTRLHPGCTREQAREATGWDLEVADDLEATAPPTSTELDALRALQARTVG